MKKVSSKASGLKIKGSSPKGPMSPKEGAVDMKTVPGKKAVEPPTQKKKKSRV